MYIVTGSAGFLGINLCKRLLKIKDSQVLGIDNLANPSPLHRELRAHPRYKFLHRDLTELTVDEVLLTAGNQPIEAVFHLASIASPKHYMNNQRATLRCGSVGTELLLQISSEVHARIVVASTSEVYGDPTIHPQKETYWGNVNPIGMRSMYDESKRYAEALCFAYLRECDTDIGVVRIFNTYGPGMAPDDGRLIPTILGQILTHRPITIHGDGTQTRSLCYVSDTVEALISMAEKTGLPGPINIGNPEEHSVAKICSIVQDLFGHSDITMISGMPDDPKRRCPDVFLAQKYLNWYPAVSLRAGLCSTYDYLRRVL